MRWVVGQLGIGHENYQILILYHLRLMVSIDSDASYMVLGTVGIARSFGRTSIPIETYESLSSSMKASALWQDMQISITNRNPEMSRHHFIARPKDIF